MNRKNDPTLDVARYRQRALAWADQRPPEYDTHQATKAQLEKQVIVLEVDGRRGVLLYVINERNPKERRWFVLFDDNDYGELIRPPGTYCAGEFVFLHGGPRGVLLGPKPKMNATCGPMGMIGKGIKDGTAFRGRA